MPISAKLLPVRTFTGLLIFILLSTCAYNPPTGQWHSFDAKSVTFSGVEIAAQTLDAGYPDICREAQGEIQKQLSQQLAERFQPLTFSTAVAPPAQHNNALLNIQITQCEVDSQQWDGGGNGLSFTYYLTLKLHINLLYDKRNLLNYEIETFEQIDTDTSGPAFEFSFEESIQRALLLFKGQQFLVPH